MALTVKQHDTWPPIKAILKETNEAGELVAIKNLGAAESITFIMKHELATVEGACTVANEATGEVQYIWGATDTAVIGLYEVEFQIKWGTGKYQSVPNEEYGEIEIVANLAKEH